MTSLLTIQHGIFLRDQARMLDIDCPKGEPAATKVLPNVYSVIPPPLTWEARMWAAALYGGKDTALVGVSGAEVTGGWILTSGVA